MYLCYIDESGTPDLPGNTTHFILAGLSIPISEWKSCDAELNVIKQKYDLQSGEVHVAWLLRPYAEQKNIQSFTNLSYVDRRSAMKRARAAELIRLQRAKNPGLLKQTKKNYKNTEQYTHLTFDERQQLVTELANTVAKWTFARLFAECIDKLHFDPNKSSKVGKTVDEHAFEQVVSRYEQYLHSIPSQQVYGLLIHDNNETVAKRHTELMKSFYSKGTLWTQVNHIVETPLFVDSQLTSMVQIADLCAYALRRYFENGEDNLFDIVFQRAEKIGERVVSIRHFTHHTCGCKVCVAHRKKNPTP